ncbi:DUF4817 domain-containing protein [Trichonephila clavipes]|nr:DUF4817 domain-containing protein [Trichonephila clavipes]
MLWSRTQRAFAVEDYFSNGCSVTAVQRDFRRHFDIPPSGHVPDWKCVLMWMDAFRTTGNVSKEKKGPLEHLKMGDEFVCQIRPVCDNHPTILLTLSPRKGF